MAQKTQSEAATTRRTRGDLRALARCVRHARFDSTADVSDARVWRLVDHGYLIVKNDLGQISVSGNGANLARAVGKLVDDTDFADDFDHAVDIMGMSTFVDEAIRSPDDFDGYVRGILVIANTIDEARHQSDTQADEYDHDGLFAPHFAPDGFDAHKGKVEVRFKTEACARVWATEWAPDRFDAHFKHDERFKGNRNPRRVIVNVLS